VGWPERLRQPGACFVTLHKGGRLRGCIGTLSARDPLHRAVVDCAQGAATRDSRFPEVRPEELKDLRIEVSVLTEARRLEYQTPAELVGRLVPHRDGVILQLDSRKATYLPQVWEQLPDPVTFLDSLAEKAGGAAGAWRAPGTVVFTYQVEAFEEPEPLARGTEG
jgi:AmmeMemoRadiSam system protein A